MIFKLKQPYVMVIAGGLLILILQVFTTQYFTQWVGTDDQSVDIIQRIAPGYTPWASSLFEFESVHAELLMFIFQASIGIAVIAYYILKHHKSNK